MSPMSLSIHSIARSSPRSIEFADFRNMRRVDEWCRVLGVSRKQLASAMSEVGEDAQEVRVFLRPDAAGLAYASASRPRFVRIAADVLRTIRARMVL